MADNNTEKAKEMKRVAELVKVHNNVKDNYEFMKKKLTEFFTTLKKDETMGTARWVQRGRKQKEGWDISKNKEIEKIRKGLAFFLQRLDKIEEIEGKIEDEITPILSAVGQADQATEISGCLEKLMKIVHRFDAVWVKSVHLEKRKGILVDVKTLEAIERETLGGKVYGLKVGGKKGIDIQLKTLFKAIGNDPGAIYLEKNSVRVDALKESLKELGKVNEDFLELVSKAVKIEGEEEKLVKNLVRGMKKYREAVRVGLIKHKGIIRGAGFEKLNISEFDDGFEHVKMDLGVEEARLVNSSITPGIVLLYNETKELEKIIEEENELIEVLSESIDEVRDKIKEHGKTAMEAFELVQKGWEALKRIRGIVISKEVPLVKKIDHVRNVMEKTLVNLRKIEARKSGLEKTGRLRRRRINRRIMEEARRIRERAAPVRGGSTPV